jgi:hypothetical protein
MECGVHAHVTIPSVPVEFGSNVVANLWFRGIFANDVPNGTAFAVTRIDNTGPSTRPANSSGVTRLAAAHRVENTAVEHDGIIVDGGDDGVALL